MFICDAALHLLFFDFLQLFLIFNSGTSRLPRLKLHVHGLINHGLHQRHLFGSMDHWSHDADFVCTILHKHLFSLKTTIPPDKWPHTLFLQVDNCWKKNKNTTVFRYLGLLVKFGWFKQVYMHSLPTGHTHEDIDQMFSTWNTHYWMSGLSSPVAVPKFLTWAYPDETKRPQFQMVQFCFNFKKWFETFRTSLKGHSQFRSFKFVLEKLQLDSNVSLFYKSTSLEETWKGISSSNNNEILLFSSFPDVSENPSLISPKPLDTDLITDLIKNSSITTSFETSCSEFYLCLQSNSTFYLIEDPSEFLFSVGSFLTQIEKVVYNSEGLNRLICTPFQLVTHEDIGQMFSTWNTHYWMSGLSSPVAVTNFLNWAYPDENKKASIPNGSILFQF